MAKSHEMKKIGDDGEKAFAEWLSNESVGYLYISQSFDFFSEVFKDAVKRPDFLVLIPSIGFIAVDVKHYKVFNDTSFTLNIPNEISKSAEFEHLTRLYLWYVYKKKDVDDDSWYFISAHDGLKHGVKKEGNRGADDFLVIDLEHFSKINSADDFGKLFSARLGTLGTISRSLEQFFTKI